MFYDLENCDFCIMMYTIHTSVTIEHPRQSCLYLDLIMLFKYLWNLNHILEYLNRTKAIRYDLFRFSHDYESTTNLRFSINSRLLK